MRTAALADEPSSSPSNGTTTTRHSSPLRVLNGGTWVTVSRSPAGFYDRLHDREADSETLLVPGPRAAEEGIEDPGQLVGRDGLDHLGSLSGEEGHRHEPEDGHEHRPEPVPARFQGSLA